MATAKRSEVSEHSADAISICLIPNQPAVVLIIHKSLILMVPALQARRMRTSQSCDHLHTST